MWTSSAASRDVPRETRNKNDGERALRRPSDAHVLLTGSLAAFDNLGLSGTPLFSTDLTGRGTAVLQFSNNAQVGLLASRISFRFEPAAPTPEPATILLVGPALAGLALARRRRSHILS
jgi:hypothetical protein